MAYFNFFQNPSGATTLPHFDYACAQEISRLHCLLNNHHHHHQQKSLKSFATHSKKMIVCCKIRQYIFWAPTRALVAMMHDCKSAGRRQQPTFLDFHSSHATRFNSRSKLLLLDQFNSGQLEATHAMLHFYSTSVAQTKATHMSERTHVPKRAIATFTSSQTFGREFMSWFWTPESYLLTFLPNSQLPCSSVKSWLMNGVETIWLKPAHLGAVTLHCSNQLCSQKLKVLTKFPAPVVTSTRSSRLSSRKYNFSVFNNTRKRENLSLFLAPTRALYNMVCHHRSIAPTFWYFLFRDAVQKKTGFFGNFSQRGGRVFSIPKTFAN